MTRYNLLQLFILLALLGICISGCSNNEYKKFIIPGKLDETRVEYLADEIVIKEGYYFLWFIPFASNNIESSEEKMVEEAKTHMPDANGLMEINVELQEDVEFFDWTPRTILRGKLIKNR